MTSEKGGRFAYTKAPPEADQKPSAEALPPALWPDLQADQVKPEKPELLALPAVPAIGSAALLNPSAFALPAQRMVGSILRPRTLLAIQSPC
jgi:hypothetical protein